MSDLTTRQAAIFFVGAVTTAMGYSFDEARLTRITERALELRKTHNTTISFSGAIWVDLLYYGDPLNPIPEPRGVPAIDSILKEIYGDQS